MKKGEIKRLITVYLTDEELVPEEDTVSLPATVDSSTLELKLLEFQEKEKARAAELKMKELELREKELSIQLRMRELETPAPRRESSPVEHPLTRPASFDVSKHIKLVPPFQEREVDKYFLHFEKIATSLEWPREVWMLLLQSVLVGKAREIYSAMSLEQSSQYEVVKKAILKAYELVPEAYRQNFRSYQKRDKQTYTEFAREKEVLFDRWCSSKEVAQDFMKLRQLILIEEFKGCLPTGVKTYIEEQKAESIQQAARLADDYTLTHRGTFEGSTFNTSGANGETQVLNKNATPVNMVKTGLRSQRRSVAPGPVCSYCKRKGHVLSECWALERKKANNPVMIVSEKKQPLLHANQQCQLEGRVMPEVSPEVEHPFVSKGFVSLTEGDPPVPVKILRDAGASQSLMLQNVLPLSNKTAIDANVLIQGVELNTITVPLHKVYLHSDLITGPVVVGIRPTLPLKGVSFVLGNDLAGGKVKPDPWVVEHPDQFLKTEIDDSIMFPACVVTRAAARKVKDKEMSDCQDSNASSYSNQPNHHIKYCDSVLTSEPDRSSISDELSFSRKQLIRDQELDSEIRCLAESAVSEEEAAINPKCYYKKGGVLMRKWRPPDAPANEEWRVVHQIVVPPNYRKEILSLAHGSIMAGHLGVNKTYHKILTYFYWPGLKKDVVQFCRLCHVCQLVGKPNQAVPAAPLQPIPVCGEPFSHVLIDCVGPLPKTKLGNQYLLTVMCKFTRFPEAIPLRNIKAPKIVESLIKFFTFVGLPASLQSDQGSNFMSNIMQQVLYQLGIKQYKSSAYHPESQGAIERFHQTLKNLMRAYCFEFKLDWDQGIHLLLFTVREAIQESLGFSPFELVYGRTVRGPLKLLKENWLTEKAPVSLLDQVSNLRSRLTRITELAMENLKASQARMKTWYDRRAKNRSFKEGEKVLALLPVPNSPLQARFCGPYLITKKLNNVNYVISTPDRRKSQRLCHVNMLKKYFERETSRNATKVAPVAMTVEVEEDLCRDEIMSGCVKLQNSDVLSNLQEKLSHLTKSERQQMISLITEFSVLFPDVPEGQTVYVTM